jgi:hypothetical protein
MKTLLFVTALMFSIGIALSAAKQPLDIGSAFFANRHA